MMRIVIVLCFVLLLASTAAFPGGSSFWQMDTFADFAKGTFTGISLSRDGRLSLAPRLKEVFSSDQALVWTAVEDSAGNVYLGTGHSGKVFRLDAKMKSGEFFDAPEPDVFALAVDRANNVYVGTSPDGKVYKVSPDGKASEFFNPQAKYIWSLLVAPDGTLYVGTGDRGRILRISAGGQGALFYDTHQAHVMSMALGTDQTLVAGTAPNGLLYRISPAGKGFVLYDAPLAEIHSVAVASDGSVLASAMAPSPQRGPVILGPGGVIGAAEALAPSSSISVQATPPVESEESKDKTPKDKEKDKLKEAREAAEKAARDAAAAAAAVAAVPNLDASLGTRSAIYRVAPDHTVETLWSSREESAFDILPAAGGLLFSTDERGRIYQLNAEKQTTLLVQTNEEQTTRLLRRGPHVLAATANFGKLFQLETTPGDRGWYESPVRDSRSISRWGKLGFRGEVPSGARLEFFTRSGNSSTPDQTWSDWEATTQRSVLSGRNDLFHDQISSPSARYLQWKAVFHATGGRSATLEEVSVAYLPQNRAPIINSVTVTPGAAPLGRLGPAPLPAAASASEPLVVVVDDTAAPAGKPPGPAVTGPPPAAAQRANATPTISIAWQVEDPDGDRMVFSVYIRGEGESEWRLLKDGLHETQFQPEPETLPDGKYQVRLVASDVESNPRETARTAEQLSAPFLIDNTPPVVQVLRQERNGATAQVRFQVTDAASVLRRAEYSLDAGPWFPIYSEDGIVDSQGETFLVKLEGLAPGEHLVVLRAYDSGNNAGMGKAILK